MKITVYLGSSRGNDIKFEKAVKELGRMIGARGDTLVFGGSKSGLMGVLADQVLASGGYVIGVEPQMFVDQKFQHESINELIVTDDLTSRRTKMIELGDAFIAFPGGVGTLDEISEVILLASLKMVNAPCILYNLDGYYDSLKELLHTMNAFGFSSEERQESVRFADSISEIEKILQASK